jgi:chromate reductase, NAD(P)H dehydrogenase (quinone)
VLGVAVGAIGTAAAQQHLRNARACRDVPTMGSPQAFVQAKDDLLDEEGRIGAASLVFMQAWMNKFAAWVRLLHQA